MKHRVSVIEFCFIGQWQPISSAKDDGEVRLGFCPLDQGDFWIGPVWFNADDGNWWSDGGCDEALDASVVVHPTHWMRLPDPPVKYRYASPLLEDEA